MVLLFVKNVTRKQKIMDTKNREIKFRAWDKKRKQMYSWEELKDSPFSLEFIFELQNYLIPLEYTNYKDKNGKEIYEGDIINKQEQYKYEVIFKDGAFGVFTSNYGWKLLSEFKQIEIIGNIYKK